MTEDGIVENKPHGRWKIAIAVFPLLLLLSVAGAVWFYWTSGRQDEVDPRLAMQAGPRDGRELDEHFEKLTRYITKRGWDSEDGRQGLRQTMAYIDGTLSPQNYGFKVERRNVLSDKGELWPVLWADLDQGSTGNWLVVEVPYDRDAADVAFVLAAIDRLRGAPLERRVRFVFSPRVPPPGARALAFDVAEGLTTEGRVVLEDLAGENLSYRLDGAEVAELKLPRGRFSLLVAGEGEVLDERVRVERARWLAGFLRSAANRR